MKTLERAERLRELHETALGLQPASDARVPVLVLADTRLILHHGCVGIVRSLGRLGVPVYSLVQDRFAPTAVSRYLAGAFIWRTRGVDEQVLLEGMDIIGKRLARPVILIPTSDVAAIFIAENAAALQAHFLFPHQPPTLPRTLANKRALYLLCARLGVPCPANEFPTSMTDVNEFVRRARFPVVVKAAESWLLPQGTPTTSIARTPEQLHAICRSVGAPQRANLIFQEYIPRADGEDWFYHGYRNTSTGCSIGFTGRKLRSYPPFAGPTTLGKTVENQSLREQAETLLERLSFCGIMDLDYRFDMRDGKYKLVDFNPRIGAQFRLFEDTAGIDVVRALYLDLTGKPVHASGKIESRTFVAEFHDLAAKFRYFGQGALSFREWWPSLKGNREWAWFCRDDPFPFWMMCIRLMLRVVERIFGTKRPQQVDNSVPRYLTGQNRRLARRNPRAA